MRIGEVDADKTAAVRNYLQREFPGRILYDFYDAARSAQVFEVQDSLGTVLHLAVVRADFLAARSEAEVTAFLEQHRVARALAEAGQLALVVSGDGVTREAA